MRNIPSAIDAIGAIFKGYLPKVFQARGWVLAGLTLMPLVVVWVVMIFDSAPNPARTSLELYHYGYGQITLPIIAIVAAPACISEDLEQRALPLMLARPAPAWTIPLAKGLLWFAWCAIWLMVAVTLMPFVGLDPYSVPRKILALLLAHWAQLGFASLLLWFFKRGTLWAVLFFYIWDPMVRVLPPALQRATFTHYLESISISRYTNNDVFDILAQTQITTPLWLCVTILLAIGALAWGISGFRLMRMPVGLAGGESEG